MDNELDVLPDPLRSQMRGLVTLVQCRIAADERLLRQALVALTYHEAMTRPIDSTTKTVTALRLRLGL